MIKRTVSRGGEPISSSEIEMDEEDMLPRTRFQKRSSDKGKILCRGAVVICQIALVIFIVSLLYDLKLKMKENERLTNLLEISSTKGQRTQNGTIEDKAVDVKVNSSALPVKIVFQSKLPFIKNQKVQKFIIPKNVWIYVENPSKQSYFVTRCLQNIRWFANKSSYKFHIINSKSYDKWLSTERNTSINETLSQIKRQRSKKQGKKEQKLHKQEDFLNLYKEIEYRLIMLEILNANGGILIQKHMILTQNFTWLEDINSNIYLNRGKQSASAQYFGFFNLDYGPILEKHNREVEYQSQRYMIKYPGINLSFFAARAAGEYLTNTLEWYHKLLIEPESCASLFQTLNLSAGIFECKEPLKQAFYIASHAVVQAKQFQIDESYENKNQSKQFAIDQLGLMTINSRYFPTKLQAVFENSFEEKIYKNLAKFPLEELEETVGPLRYMVSMMMESHMNYRLQGARNGNNYYHLHPESFFSKFLFMDREYDFILKTYEKPFVNSSGLSWDSLPKIVWLFWDKGIEKSTLANKLCVENIRKNAEAIGFQLKMVNSENIQTYIDSDVIQRIDKIAESRKIETFAPLKSNFYRIALIAKYGGIYMDVSFFGVQDFTWLINIAKYPSQYVFNRYGQLPKIFMYFHPHFGQPFEFIYDKKANTKMMWLSALQNNMIVAEPNQQFFKDWFDEYELFITIPYDLTQKKMKYYEVFDDRWTNKRDTYLAAMDSLKNTLGKKQTELKQKLKELNYTGPKSAQQYYRIWSMSGYRGQQKFRPHTNFDLNNFRNPYSSDNPFLYRYSKEYVDGIVGEVNQLGKLYSWNIRHLNEFIEANVGDNFTYEAHPESYFMKYLYDTTRLKIELIDQELIIVK